MNGIQVSQLGEHTTWLVSVNDEAAAKAQLLRQVVSDAGLNVLEFGRKKYELEDVFLSIVEGGQHG